MAGKVKDVTFQKYGKLTALRYIESIPGKGAVWEYRCECGSVRRLVSSQVSAGRVRSCGCLPHGNYKHGRSESAEYKIWVEIIRRCKARGRKGSYIYVERGIDIASEWKKDFMAFYSYMGPRPSPRHSVDRIDNNLGYIPGNVRWATYTEQARNRRNNKILTCGGISQCLTAWAETLGIPLTRFRSKLKSGCSLEQLVTAHGGNYATIL